MDVYGDDGCGERGPREPRELCPFHENHRVYSTMPLVHSTMPLVYSTVCACSICYVHTPPHLCHPFFTRRFVPVPTASGMAAAGTQQRGPRRGPSRTTPTPAAMALGQYGPEGTPGHMLTVPAFSQPYAITMPGAPGAPFTQGPLSQAGLTQWTDGGGLTQPWDDAGMLSQGGAAPAFDATQGGYPAFATQEFSQQK